MWIHGLASHKAFERSLSDDNAFGTEPRSKDNRLPREREDIGIQASECLFLRKELFRVSEVTSVEAIKASTLGIFGGFSAKYRQTTIFLSALAGQICRPATDIPEGDLLASYAWTIERDVFVHDQFVNLSTSKRKYVLQMFAIMFLHVSTLIYDCK